MRGQSTLGATWRFIVFGGLMIALLAGIVQAIQRPVAGGTNGFDALFTDANGLKTGDDVRMFGLAVGKVSKISLDGTQARVRFTVQGDRPVYRTTRLAIRYQSLAGQRYLDIQQPSTSGTPVEAGTTFGTDSTTPSFDITTLFNGMEPVLREFSSEALNQLALNALAVFEGDGSRIGATLNAVGTLSAYATDRQAVISLLLRNFQEIADQIGGHSPEAGILIQGISDVFVNLQQQFDGLMRAVDIAPPVLGSINSLLASLGLTQPANPDLDADLRRLFPDPAAALDTLGKLPGLLQSLAAAIPGKTSTVNRTCGNGPAAIPPALSVLLNGQRITVCSGR